jgi:hypothetical protein
MFTIIDETETGPTKVTPTNVEPLSEDFGRNLDTLEKARLWLTNPHNWHQSSLFIMKWNGLLCSVSREHGQRLLAEPWDDGLPWAAVYGQRQIREGRAAASGSNEPSSEQEHVSEEESSYS